jgi:sulfatase maturation enzyme AslB (radical SAM superfamily)
MKNNHHEEFTQKYSSWGDKLLQHTDVLSTIQNQRKFVPINIQIAPCEVCDSDCPFCSVQNRPLRSKLPFKKIQKVLEDFRILGAKAIEITGGGNPMLYRDGDRDINDIIECASALGYQIGIITNSHNLSRIKVKNHSKVTWLRISLIKLDEGVAPESYVFNGFSTDKLGFSYIIYDKTTKESIDKIAKLVSLHPGIKFVRLAGDCLIKGNNAEVREKFKDVIDEIDKHSKFFFKEIGYEDAPFDHGCYVGMIRPYVAASPHGDDYRVYPCTSYVLNKRTYDLDYSLCSVDNILVTWDEMNRRFKETGHPYEIKGNGGKNWCNTCKYCYYKNNNKLLHSVVTELPDKNFA